MFRHSPDGQLISEINPSVDIGICFIRHAIKLSNGHFLFSYGSFHEEPHRVCIDIVDAYGRLTRPFGGKCGPKSEQMRRPSFVVGFKSYFSEKHGLSKDKYGLQYPSRIILNESSGRMFVAEKLRILIFQIK